MNKSVRAIVIKDDKLLVMDRDNNGNKYLTLIGGTVDEGETNEQALLREVSEETGLTVKNLRLVFIDDPGQKFGKQYVYLCDYADGEPKLATDSIEQKLNQQSENIFKPRWLKLADLSHANLMSPELKKAIQAALKSGWPKQPQALQ